MPEDDPPAHLREFVSTEEEDSIISRADVRDFSAINRALYSEHGASIVRFDVLRSFFANTNSEGDPSTVMADPEPAAV